MVYPGRRFGCICVKPVQGYTEKGKIYDAQTHDGTYKVYTGEWTYVCYAKQFQHHFRVINNHTISKFGGYRNVR